MSKPKNKQKNISKAGLQTTDYTFIIIILGFLIVGGLIIALVIKMDSDGPSPGPSPHPSPGPSPHPSPGPTPSPGPPDISCTWTGGANHLGTCSNKFSTPLPSPSASDYPRCYVKDNKSTRLQYGATTTPCCLRFNEEAPPTNTVTYSYLLGLLATLPNWPRFSCNDLGIKKYPLGTYLPYKKNNYIIDPTFNWGPTNKSKRIGDDDLNGIINKSDIPRANLSQVSSIQGEFCSVKTDSTCNTHSPGPSPTPPSPSPHGPGGDTDLDLFFPPYDCPIDNETMIDLGMIRAVTKAALAAQKSGPKLNPDNPNNPFQIKYCVYNLYDMAYLTLLINARKANVYVQLLVFAKQIQPEFASYNKIYTTLQKARFNVQSKITDTQLQATEADLDRLNLIGITLTKSTKGGGKLMHCKTRYYKFGSPYPVQIGDKFKTISEAIVTGSFNPECSATSNNEYLVVLTGKTVGASAVIQDYLTIYNYVKKVLTKFAVNPPKNTFPTNRIYSLDKKPISVFYSGWCAPHPATENYMRHILAMYIDLEQQAILLPLYSLSDLDSPNKYTNMSTLDVSYIPADSKIFGSHPKLILKSVPQNPYYFTIGAEISITDTNTTTESFFIRKITYPEVELIPSTIHSQLITTLQKVILYPTLLVNLSKAIKRDVKVILLINKAQADGEVNNAGSSFTGGNPKLTSYLVQQMGGTVWKCNNPLGQRGGELHSKNGYFYSQNILITDTTNWSQAGMGTQGAKGPSCGTSSVNSETALVIQGQLLPQPLIFRMRVLANFANTARMYAYQQPCPYTDTLNFGGFTACSGKCSNKVPYPLPLNNPNNTNCACPKT